MNLLVKGGAVVAVIVVVLVALNRIGKWFSGWGHGGGTDHAIPSSVAPPNGASKGLVITIDAEQYLIDGKTVTLEQVVAGVNALPTDQRDVEIIQKPNAKFLSVKSLHDSLKEKNIHPRTTKAY